MTTIRRLMTTKLNIFDGPYIAGSNRMNEFRHQENISYNNIEGSGHNVVLKMEEKILI